MYNYTVKYVNNEQKLVEGEFQSPSAYIDATTNAHMQIYLNSVMGGYENAGSVGIISITPVDLSIYGESTDYSDLYHTKQERDTDAKIRREKLNKIFR